MSIERNEIRQLSHRKWKALKRKLKRQTSAKQKAENQHCEDNEVVIQVPSDDQSCPGENEGQEPAERQHQHNMWLERERQAQIAWKVKKDWEEKEKIRRQKQEQQIREEWEERVKKEKEEEEKRDKTKREQEALLKKATENEKQNGGEWHNPIAPVQYSQERKRDPCSFFVKTGACRFGERCSRAHDHPERSRTLLIPKMYSNFKLEQSWLDEYDTDLGLEYDENEMQQHFRGFYHDVVPEFASIGQLVQFKVCCNYEPHLRGNVYIMYERQDEAELAYQKFNARWYGGKQLSCQFCSVESWKQAICGLFNSKRCPKGKACNFLHVFPNPGNEFWQSDKDFHLNDTSNRRRTNQRDRSSRHSTGYDNSNSSNYGRYKSRDYRANRSPTRESRLRRSRESRRSRSRERSHVSRGHSRSSRSPVRYRKRSKERSHESRNRKRSRSNDRQILRSGSRDLLKRSRSKERSPRKSQETYKSPPTPESVTSSDDSPHYKKKDKKSKKHKSKKSHKHHKVKMDSQ